MNVASEAEGRLHLGLPSAALRPALPRVLAAFVAMALAACTLAEALRTEPGVDTAAVRPGATREQVEAVLGPPTKTWKLTTGVEYRVYRYYAGKDASAYAATQSILLNIATLGVLELLYEADADTRKAISDSGKKEAVLAVSYDDQGLVLGVFSDFSQFRPLPADGRSVQAPAGQTTAGH